MRSRGILSILACELESGFWIQTSFQLAGNILQFRLENDFQPGDGSNHASYGTVEFKQLIIRHIFHIDECLHFLTFRI